ncbi:MAG TPA: hypothetical protein VM597_19515, partial [Gemmataceae bacterium]|nr:hypothetical protein [Gemmataceae bacterium]
MRPVLPWPVHPVVCLLALGAAPPLAAAEPAALVVESPKPHQVVQRTGFDPATATTEQPGHPAFGFADVPVRCAAAAPDRGRWEYRVVRLAGGAADG